MAIVINGSGTVTGLAVGGLPDGTVDAGTLATDSVTAAKIAANSVDSAELVDGAVDDSHMASISGRKNILINGGFEIAQRGTTISGIGSAKYTLDRWNAISSGADSTVTQVSGATYPKALRLTGAGSTSGTYLQQKIESTNSRHLAGQTATFSVYLRASTAINIEFSIKYATSADNFGGTTSIASTTFNVTTTDTKFTWTGSIPSAATTGIQVELKISSQGSAWYEASNAQLELGSTATDFEHRSYGEELTLCQRYFQRYQAEQQEWLYNEGNAAHGKWWQLVYSEMRAGPTVTFDSGWTGGGAAGLSGTVTAISASSNPYRLSARVTFSATGGSAYNVHHTDSFNGSYCYLDAEL